MKKRQLLCVFFHLENERPAPSTAADVKLLSTNEAKKWGALARHLVS